MFMSHKMDTIIILILIYINSHTAHAAANAVDLQAQITKDPNLTQAVCIVETTIAHSTDSETECNQINKVCKVEIQLLHVSVPCFQELPAECRKDATCVPVALPNLCGKCVYMTFLNCSAQSNTGGMTVLGVLTCNVDKKLISFVYEPVQVEGQITTSVSVKETSTISQFRPDKNPTDTTSLDTTYGTGKASLNSGNTTEIGIAVGISIGTLFIICLFAVVLIIHRKWTNQKKDIAEQNRHHENGNEYIGDQDIALPQIENSTEYCELNTRYNSHKYTDVKHMPLKPPETTYDYIDDLDRKHLSSSSDVMMKTATFDPDTHLNVNKTNTDYSDGNYSILDPEGECTDLLARAEPSLSGGDYAVLDPNETGFNRSGISVTQTNTSYAVLDPVVTGYDRSHVENGYELAKAVTTEIKNNGSEQSSENNSAYERTFGQNENDYNTANQQSKCQSKENVYHHSVDAVYDTANQNRKAETPDITYDHFVGHKTVDDYDKLKS